MGADNTVCGEKGLSHARLTWSVANAGGRPINRVSLPSSFNRGEGVPVFKVVEFLYKL